jgi:hypothetical protein
MLEAMEKTISLAQLAKNTEKIARDIEMSGTLYRIKRPGRRRLVLVDDNYFERWKATMEFIAQHPNWEEELEQGRREYEAGLCIPWEQLRKELGLDAPRAHAARRNGVARSTKRRGAKAR